MPSSSSYKLHSTGKTANGEQPVCAFFSSPAGCRNGDNCKFLHANNSGGSNSNNKKESSAEVSEISSVVSSESEGETEKRQSTGKKNKKQQQQQKIEMDDDPFAVGNQPQFKQQGKDEPSNKKKKRKSSDNRDPFSGSKIKIPGVDNTEIKVEPPVKKQKKAKTPKQNEASSSSAPDFRSFASNLPVASFSIPEASSKSTPAKKQNDESRSTPDRKPSSSAVTDVSSSTSKKEGKHRSRRILPSDPAVMNKWGLAITKGRQHERYDGSFDFKRYKENEESNGIKADWIKAKPYGAWCKNNPQAIAIDCEMCETQDPLSGAKNHKALCRLSVVNADKPEEVLLDTLVKPSWPVTDYRTRINGVTKEHLDNVEFTMRHAQAFMMALCSDETVVVGHAVHNDLVALNLEHDVVADSAFLYEAKDSTSASCSLKDIVKKVFNEEMPKTHDSVNDARKAMECVVHWIEKKGNVETIERTPKHHAHSQSDKLFVHRIAKSVKREHMISMFLNQTTIQPVDVEEIAFTGNTGKTHVSFKSAAHADLAFDSIDGKADEDLSGRLQKKVYLRNGDYIRIRKMTRTMKRPSLGGNTPSKREEATPRSDRGSATKSEPSYAPFASSFRDMEFSKPAGWK